MSSPTDDGKARRKDLEHQETELIRRYALRSAERRKCLGDGFREHEVRTDLEYRTEYHRDRDRIVWSRAFKRLQHKTQVFPHYVEDHYRRRLTHALDLEQANSEGPERRGGGGFLGAIAVRRPQAA